MVPSLRDTAKKISVAPCVVRENVPLGKDRKVDTARAVKTVSLSRRNTSQLEIPPQHHCPHYLAFSLYFVICTSAVVRVRGWTEIVKRKLRKEQAEVDRECN
jgi:hypothetical protein